MTKSTTTTKPAPVRTGRVLKSLATPMGPTEAPAKPAAVPSPVAAAPAGFRPAAFAPTARIVVVAEACPKRPGSKAARAWLAYTTDKGKPVTTVAEAVARFVALGLGARYARSALLWDSRHGFIKIG